MYERPKKGIREEAVRPVGKQTGRLFSSKGDAADKKGGAKLRAA
jgi:hypothetical protein